MKISGFQGIRDHMPDYTEKQVKRIILRLPGFSLIYLMFQILIAYSMKFFNKISPNEIWLTIEPFIPILLNVIFIFGGTVRAQTGFRLADKLKKENPRTAYQNVVKTILGGISMVFSALFFSFIPIINPISSSTEHLSEAFFGIFNNANNMELLQLKMIIRCVFAILGCFLLIIGLRIAYRAVQESGIDTAAMVYVYYPNEAKVINSEIYSIIRHPMYLSIFLIAISSFFIYFSFYAFIILIIIAISFYRHIFIIEEKELLDRFGQNYIEYAKEVPALFIRRGNWKKFLQFLINSSATKQ